MDFGPTRLIRTSSVFDVRVGRCGVSDASIYLSCRSLLCPTLRYPCSIADDEADDVESGHGAKELVRYARRARYGLVPERSKTCTGDVSDAWSGTYKLLVPFEKRAAEISLWLALCLKLFSAARFRRTRQCLVCVRMAGVRALSVLQRLPFIRLWFSARSLEFSVHLNRCTA